MAHAVFFGTQITLVIFVRTDFYRHVLNYLKSVTFQTHALHWIVCQQTYLAHAEFTENLRTDTIVTFVWVETEVDVGINSVKTFFLEFAVKGGLTI